MKQNKTPGEAVNICLRSDFIYVKPKAQATKAEIEKTLEPDRIPEEGPDLIGIQEEIGLIKKPETKAPELARAIETEIPELLKTPELQNQIRNLQDYSIRVQIWILIIQKKTNQKG